MESGIVSNIQHYSLQDGPGIRTTVFLKGCPLHCLWCCNPETQEHSPEEMKGVMCGVRMTAAEVVDECEKDEIFYRHGEGGITISGGEPLMQADFTLAIIEEAKERYLPSAIETTGYGDTNKLVRMAGLLKTIHMDIKSLDRTKHKEWTGVDNTLILQNIEKIALLKERGDMIIRTPVIPGFNDNVTDIRDIAGFISDLNRKTGKKIRYELLPYHRFGRDKYTSLGREYPMGDRMLDRDLFEELKRAVIFV